MDNVTYVQSSIKNSFLVVFSNTTSDEVVKEVLTNLSSISNNIVVAFDNCGPNNLPLINLTHIYRSELDVTGEDLEKGFAPEDGALSFGLGVNLKYLGKDCLTLLGFNPEEIMLEGDKGRRGHHFFWQPELSEENEAVLQQSMDYLVANDFIDDEGKILSCPAGTKGYKLPYLSGNGSFMIFEFKPTLSTTSKGAYIEVASCFVRFAGEQEVRWNFLNRNAQYAAFENIKVKSAN